MVRLKYIATPAGLRLALQRAKHLKRIKSGEHSPAAAAGAATTHASREEISPFTLREGVFCELKS